MDMTSAAEANLDARIRPEVSALRSKTSYSRRRSDNGLPPPEPPRVSASPAGPSAPIRLTRRGRIVVWTLAAVGVAALTILIWLAVAGQAQASSHLNGRGPTAGSVQRVVVKPGQTLWSIAAQTDPAADPRLTIGEIVDLNSLRGTGIQVGQVLLVPEG
jgi:nucleoid-associated protein YgaU